MSTGKGVVFKSIDPLDEQQQQQQQPRRHSKARAAVKTKLQRAGRSPTRMTADTAGAASESARGREDAVPVSDRASSPVLEYKHELTYGSLNCVCVCMCS